MSTPAQIASFFELLTEVGIVSQLANAELARHLEGGLAPAHFAVLSHLERVGSGWTLARTARAMQVTRATMTHTVAVLEARGLVRVTSNPDDARSKLVFLTDAGRAYRARAFAALAEPIARVAAQIDLEFVLAARPALVQLRAALDRDRERPHTPA